MRVRNLWAAAPIPLGLGEGDRLLSLIGLLAQGLQSD